jgi:hypothetical protein
MIMSKFRTILLAWGIPVIIAVSCCYLATLADLRTAAPELAGASALITCLLALALLAGDKGSVSWSPPVILALAAFLRLLFLFRGPELSDDIYRYLWDGLQTLAGHNPYALAPATALPGSAELAVLVNQVNHPQLVTIYPPVAQGFFAVGAAAGGSVLGMKAVLTLVDLITCAMLIRLLPAFGLPSSRAILYAWHPLPVLEIAVSGHIDGAGVFFTIATLALLAPGRSSAATSLRQPRQRFFLAGIAFAAAALVKMLPVVFLPGLLILVRQGAKRLFLLGAIVGGLVVTVPFLPELANGLTTLGIYLHDWEFAGFLFRALRRALSSGALGRLVLAGSFVTVMALLYGKLFFRLKAGAADTSAEAKLPVVTTFYGIVMAFLLLTPTLHPWYALYLVVLLPFAAGPAGLVLGWSVLLAYRVLISSAILGQWIEDDLLPALIWLAPVGAFLVCLLATALRDRLPRES